MPQKSFSVLLKYTRGRPVTHGIVGRILAIKSLDLNMLKSNQLPTILELFYEWRGLVDEIRFAASARPRVGKLEHCDDFQNQVRAPLDVAR